MLDGFSFDSGATARTLNVRIPPNARFGRSVRQKVHSFAGNAPMRQDELEEFIFAVGEALANAIEHSRSTDVIEVRCQVEDDKILATIIDSGSGFQGAPLPNVTLPPELMGCESESGGRWRRHAAAILDLISRVCGGSCQGR